MNILNHRKVNSKPLEPSLPVENPPSVTKNLGRPGSFLERFGNAMRLQKQKETQTQTQTPTQTPTHMQMQMKMPTEIVKIKLTSALEMKTYANIVQSAVEGTSKIIQSNISSGSRLHLI